MRIKLDENLPVELGDDLRALGHDVDAVVTERLTGRPDSVIVTAARTADRVLFTLDKGVGDVRRFPPAEAAGIVLFRCKTRGRGAARALVRRSMHRLPEELAGRLVVVSESSVRTRRR
jgi:predicted nuclease of predicted toxin-antitoxin system